MQNILVNALPSSVEIDGEECEINTDYRGSLYTILAFEDEELTPSEKVGIMLDNLYFDIPSSIEKAVIKAQWFLNGGVDDEEKESSRRLYSFSQDANFIYSAFKQTHGVDLQNDDLHWWKFLALFMDLGQDTTYCQLVGLRSKFYAGRCTKEEKEHIANISDIFYIKESVSMNSEEREESQKFREDYEKAKERRRIERAK